MESNEQTELMRKMGTDSQMESRLTAIRRRLEGGRIEQKGKRLTDNSAVIMGGREGMRGLNGNGKI